MKTARSDNAWGFCYTEEIAATHFVVYCGDRDTKLYAIVKGADATDFNDNFKAGATSVASEGLALSKINSGLYHPFNNEALASGVYEDSIVIGCDRANKTFTIENKHATGSLNYKIWGSPNNTDYEEIKPETLLIAQTKVTVVNNDFWKFVKLQAQGVASASTIDAYLQVG